MKRKLDYNLIMSIVILLLLIVTFEVLTGGRVLEKRNLLSLFNQSVTTIIAGLGMIFVVSMGGTDITTGVVCALAGAFAAIAAGISFWLAFPAAIAVGIIVGLIMGISNAKFKVPSFMASLAILIAGRAGINWILNDSAVYATQQMLALDMYRFKVPILIILIAIIAYVFEYTPFGNYTKAIGENENAVVHMGVNVKKIKILAFIISAVMAALAGVFSMARTGGASNTMGAGMEMQVMMALFIGGIPVTGGIGSKIYKLILGAPMMVLLDNGLILCGSTGPITQEIRGIALILIVGLSLILNKQTIVNRAKKTKADVETA